uniref:Uncharacterized protein n=1 Tax=Leptobrachium leishanense TaxID=445787 RepID=A0A8C5QIY0_9ANUR
MFLQITVYVLCLQVPVLIHIWKFVSRIFYTIIDWKGKVSSLCGFEIPIKRVVGIFSRDQIPQWLQDVLSSETLLIKVRSYYISNNSYQSFREETTHCDFAILYHTKNRGRVNITDVTDSLYDQELQELSTKLGKENVIVLVDDLDDGGPQTKENILKNQPSIGKYAQDLILVSAWDKDHHEDSFTEKQRHMLAIMAKSALLIHVKGEGMRPIEQSASRCIYIPSDIDTFIRKPSVV